LKGESKHSGTSCENKCLQQGIPERREWVGDFKGLVLTGYVNSSRTYTGNRKLRLSLTGKQRRRKKKWKKKSSQLKIIVL